MSGRPLEVGNATALWDLTQGFSVRPWSGGGDRNFLNSDESVLHEAWLAGPDGLLKEKTGKS